jgi:hypothetical protein
MYENHKVEKFKYRNTVIELELQNYFKDRQRLYNKTQHNHREQAMLNAIVIDDSDLIDPYNRLEIEENSKFMEYIFESMLESANYARYVRCAIDSRRLEKIKELFEHVKDHPNKA